MIWKTICISFAYFTPSPPYSPQDQKDKKKIQLIMCNKNKPKKLKRNGKEKKFNI